MARLRHDFFDGDTLAIARMLLGKYLVRNRDGTLLAGRITETEAYIGRQGLPRLQLPTHPTDGDAVHGAGPCVYLFDLRDVSLPELCHGAGGGTCRRAVAGAGACCGDGSHAAPAVWGRAHERLPKEELPQRPGKVCKALDLTTAQNRLDLEGDPLFLCDSMADVGLKDLPIEPEHLCSGPRIGVDYAEEARDFPWRFWLEKDSR